MMSKVSEGRDELVAGINSMLTLPSWRVLRTTPEIVAAPCIYVDVPGLDVEDMGNGVRLTRVAFPVVIVVDGGDTQQIEQLDEAIAQTWDGIESTKWTALDGRSVNLDVGGPRLRAVIITALGKLMGRTLCVPSLSEGN